MKKPRSSKGGIRKDLGIYVRSSWEHNYALYLNWLRDIGQIIDWEYEPKEFEFYGIKRGTRFYKPDFKVTYKDGHYEWHEIKGHLDNRSRTQLKRMAKYYPEEIIRVVDKSVYQAIKDNFARLFPGWE